jgi:membrane associated rhomboid family serine protease
MQTNRNLIEDLKYRYKHGGMTLKLIFINAIVFIAIGIIEVFSRLIGPNAVELSTNFLYQIFTLRNDFFGFITHPWGIVTSIFAHFGFMHFLMNMIFLYFAGKMFEQLFDEKRLLLTYMAGGIAGGLLEIIAHQLFPTLQQTNSVIVGASGSVMAIFMALAFYRPNLEVNLFGILPVRLIFLALILFLSNLFSLGSNDGTAHFAHIGGALLGALSVHNIESPKNILWRFQKLYDPIARFFLNLFSTKKPKFKVKKGSGRGNVKTDEEYNQDKKERQKEIDIILDKISKSGYESLTKAEKNFLFNQSKNG